MRPLGLTSRFSKGKDGASGTRPPRSPNPTHKNGGPAHAEERAARGKQVGPKQWGWNCIITDTCVKITKEKGSGSLHKRDAVCE